MLISCMSLKFTGLPIPFIHDRYFLFDAKKRAKSFSFQVEKLSKYRYGSIQVSCSPEGLSVTPTPQCTVNFSSETSDAQTYKVCATQKLTPVINDYCSARGRVVPINECSGLYFERQIT